MKKIISLLCLLACILSCFAACAEEEPGSDGDTTTTAALESSTSDADNGGSSPSAQGESTKLTYDDLELIVSRVELSEENKAIATVSNNAIKQQITFKAVKEGSYTATFYNAFNHAARVKVTVGADLSIQAAVLTKPTQIEVNRYRYNGTVRRTDTEMIQAAIDAAHTKYNSTGTAQTVFVCPGGYSVEYLQMKSGVTLKLYTEVTNAKDGYTNDVYSMVKAKKIAVFNMSGRIINVPRNTYASNCSTRDDFSIIGGMLDLRGSGTCALILAMGDNINIENVIFKDVRNGHSIQITGSTNVTVKNCMFAGYRISNTSPRFSAEVIQVEPTAATAIGSPESEADVRFKSANYGIACENITIDGCYFGKSDEYAAPLLAVGHHSINPKGKSSYYNVKSLIIKNCLFDECVYAGVRINCTNNLQILDNTFRVTSASNWQAYKAEMNALATAAGVSVDDYPSGKTACIHLYNHGYTSGDYGNRGVKITGNTFEIGAGCDRRAIYYESVTSNSETATIKNNTITFGGAPTYSDYYLCFTGTTLTYTKGTVTLGGATFSTSTSGEKGVKWN